MCVHTCYILQVIYTHELIKQVLDKALDTAVNTAVQTAKNEVTARLASEQQALKSQSIYLLS